MAYAYIDAHRTFAFHVDPYNISWGYNLRTQTTDTYGGRVVQILGVELTTLTIETVAGGEGYPYLQEMQAFFREMALWQQRPNATPATFAYPPKGYNLKFWGQRFNYQNSLDNVVYPVQITGMIQDDVAGNLKAGIMTEELKKLAEGVGYSRNSYNDPAVGDLNIDAVNNLKKAASASDPATGAVGTTNGATTVSIPDDKIAETVINRALKYLGTTYAWGGGDANGPTQGIRDGGTADSYGDYNKIGFDCSGLIVYAYAGVNVTVPHYTQDIFSAFPQVDKGHILPGDCILYSSNGRADGIHHVVLYMGNNTGVEAPQSGDVVKKTTGVLDRGEFFGIVRPR